MSIASVIDGIQRFIAMFAPVSIQSLGRDQPGRVGIAHHCLMPSASVIDGIQRFIAMFTPVSIQSLGRDQGQKPDDVVCGEYGGQCPPYIPTSPHAHISLDRSG